MCRTSAAFGTISVPGSATWAATRHRLGLWVPTFRVCRARWLGKTVADGGIRLQQRKERKILDSLLPMARFAYNNTKNASSGSSPLELNCGFTPHVPFEDVDPPSELNRSWTWPQGWSSCRASAKGTSAGLRVYDVSHVSLLEQSTLRKERVDAADAYEARRRDRVRSRSYLWQRSLH